MTLEHPIIAVLGGTGAEGSGLALRWSAAGYPVYIGSRTAEKAVATADELNAALAAANVTSAHPVRGLDNRAAAQVCDIAVLTVPYSAHLSTLLGLHEALQGKILVDVTVPLKPPNVRTFQQPAGQSASLEAQALLGGDVRVVCAFQNISAHHLKDLQHQIDCDVLVCGDDVDARDAVLALVAAAGMRGLHAGSLQNSIVVEGLTSILIGLNIKYKIKNAGLRITGLPNL